MGVRFECPAGHKLHVKAHLAGQRAICPECGARFIVPSFSGARVPEAPSSSDNLLPNGHVSVSLESTVTYNTGLSDLAGSAGDETQESDSWDLPLTVGAQKPVPTARAAQLRRRKQLNQWLTVGLAVLAMVLLAVLVVVLNRPDEAPPDEDAASPTAGEPFADAPASP